MRTHTSVNLRTGLAHEPDRQNAVSSHGTFMQNQRLVVREMQACRRDHAAVRQEDREAMLHKIDSMIAKLGNQ